MFLYFYRRTLDNRKLLFVIMNLNKFKVSAPGNLSLFGEHAVEHGKSGIAAAVNLRTTLSFTELLELYSEGLIRLEFPQISLLVSISVQQFLDFYSHCKQDIKVLPDQVRRFVASNSHMYKTMNQEAIVRAFFYVLASVTFEQKINMKSIHIELSTKLMTNSNFICLTPATVCFAACFLHWSYLQKDINYHNTFDNYDLKKICLYAAECEETFYNSRSIGPSVCTYGSIIKYKIIDDYARVELFIDISNQIILLVDSKQTPSLEIQMQRLTELMNIHPKAASSIFNKIEFATDMASDAFCHLNKLNYKSDADIEKHPSILLENNVLMVSLITRILKKCHSVTYIYFV